MIKGVVAGSFDIIHPGYIKLFKDAKLNCDYFIVLLHNNPNIDRRNKNKPILSMNDRLEILESIKYIDEVYCYDTEDDLYNLLKKLNPNIRFLGDDYLRQKITGDDLNIPIKYIDRSHGWSLTKLKKMLIDNIDKNNIDKYFRNNW